MDLAMGAMGALLPKLGELLKEEYMMQTGMKKDVESFTAELRSMRAALERVAEVPRELLDPEVKLWAGDLRELSYDMEDVVDSVLVLVKGSEPDADTDGFFKELMRKIGNMGSLFTKGKARRQIATEMKEIKAQVQDVATRHKRYKVDGVFANLTAATRIPSAIDPLLVAMYENQQRIVGISNARDELIEKLRVDDDLSRQPKILSIVGSGGLGKTTLAKAVYDKLKSGFDCVAFVPVSQNPDLKRVFKDLLFEVDKERYKSLSGAMLDERQLIDQLRESLGTKRYFMIIDDIWDINAWRTIQFAFMSGNCGSRIITTTRNVNVSRECCSYNNDMVYNMKPLSEDDSQRLFYNRIFPRETICPTELEQVSTDILKKCGGVPLAIITLASHLAVNQEIKPKSQWYDLLNSIGRGLIKDDTNLQEMKKILSISFYDLPSYLKTCLLYLSVFPEDFYIDRDRLIGRWIAEGFIHGDNLFELGERYFNELINRSMIQPMQIGGDGSVKGCSVHDMMLDLICDLASEQNFVTVLDAINGDTPFERKVRRISLQKNMTELANAWLATTSMSQVRSFTIFSPAINQMLPLSKFQLLRVLDLEGCYLEGSHRLNLRCVENLLHLRYLGLKYTILHEIPMEIGKLLFLQILDLRVDCLLKLKLPVSFPRLRNLICMHLQCYTILPVGFRILTSLEELTGVLFRKDDDDVEVLGYLTELRVLLFMCGSSLSSEKFLILIESLGKLQKLQSLDIHDDGDNMDLMRGWIPPPHLRRIMLRGWFETLPTWISPSSLPLLSYLFMKVHKVRFEDIQILWTLPALCWVFLGSDIVTVTEECAMEKLVLSADAFPCVRQCDFSGIILVPSMFTRGAMPMVRTLMFDLRVSDVLSADLDLSIRNLPSLHEVYIRLHGEDASSERFSEAEAALRRAADDHPNCDLRLAICHEEGGFSHMFSA